MTEENRPRKNLSPKTIITHREKLHHTLPIYGFTPRTQFHRINPHNQPVFRTIPANQIPKIPSKISIPPSSFFVPARNEEDDRSIMRSLLDSIPKFHPQTKDDLPISQSPKSNAHLIGLRRRIISSFSVKIQPLSASCSWAALRRSNSSPAFIEEFARGPLRRWWDWSFGWLLSKKPGFARDLEMNDEEAAILGCHSKGTIRHLFHKIRSEIRKIRPSETLPMTAAGKFSYDSFNYAKNFDEGLVRD